MRRVAILCAGAGAALLAGALALALLGGVRVLPSYLTAWLFCLGIPVGALAVLMALEIAGGAHAALADPLRGVVVALPLLAILSIPLLLSPASVFAPGVTPGFTLRAILFLVLWSLLAVLFMRRPARADGPRRGLAIAGLALHLVIATIAAEDWNASLDPGLGSNSFGLTAIVSQCGAAVSVAILIAAASTRRWAAPSGLAALLLALLGAWMFLQFTQFLVVWSANLPSEVTWYQHRSAGIGWSAEWTAIGACLAALLLLLPRRYEVLTHSLAIAAGAVLFAHIIETFWLVAPAFHGQLAVTGPDLLTLCGLLGMTVGASLLFGRWTEQRHVRA